MNCRQRVATALRHEPVDRVPYNVGFTVPAHQKMADFYGDPNFESRLGNHLHMVPSLRVEWGKRDEGGWYVDEFGTRWNRSVDRDIGMPIPSLTRENFDTFAWPDPQAPGRFDALVKARRDDPDRFLIMSVDLSLFERAWVLLGMEEFLSAMITDAGFARALLDRIADLNVRVVRAGLKACPDVDGVIFGDDFGTQLGVMMGPKLWREMIGPCVARQYAAVHEAGKGKKVFIHSCGKVDDLFEDFVRLGVDCFNPFQPEVIDVFAAKEKYRGRLAFYGGISTQKLLPYGSPSEVREKVSELLERLGKSGGYIASPAHAIPGDAPAENIHAMLETLKNQ
ncbi:MAG: uroporphyrinogen decarboxylase family protein [Phycisphaerae bacterium]|nr:uroporphyrinogen decarboxylase family protein [Phycisphaerae bacterium]